MERDYLIVLVVCRLWVVRQWQRRALDVMLWPIARSAADLLTCSDLRRVRQCARREGCDWLFVDTSKNQSRRWCSMSMCGSLDKARRYYQRKRTARRAKARGGRPPRN